jgi:hypothetical protein
MEVAMDRRATISEGVLSTKALAARYYKGFDDTNHTRQAPGLPNHLAWCLGHCAHTMNRIAEAFDGRGLPETDFVLGSATNDRERFGTEAVCFGSKVQEAVWPSLARCVRVYDGAADRLAAAVRGCDDAKLDTMIKWGAGEIPLYQAGMRMIFHNGVHVGQIADLRRALGMGSVLG